jgi:hypothetical protein
MAKTVQDFFVAGAMPQDGALYELDQDIFPTDAPNGLVTPPVFKHTYTTAEQSLLSATYNIGLAFLEIA